MAYLTEVPIPGGGSTWSDPVVVCPEGSAILAGPSLELLWMVDRYGVPDWQELPHRTAQALRIVAPSLRR